MKTIEEINVELDMLNQQITELTQYKESLESEVFPTKAAIAVSSETLACWHNQNAELDKLRRIKETVCPDYSPAYGKERYALYIGLSGTYKVSVRYFNDVAGVPFDTIAHAEYAAAIMNGEVEGFFEEVE